MIYIGICDDEPIILHELQNNIIKICDNEKIEAKICAFESGEALLEHIEKINIVFLDIEMPQMDGIELGRKIKECNPQCKIIMATGMVERFKDAFRIQAFRFVTKPFDKWELEEALKAAMQNELGDDMIELFSQRIPVKVSHKQIKYVQAFNGYAEFKVEDHIFRKEISLNELENILNSKMFVRVHRQYIVNLHWVNNYVNGIVYIANKQIAVARRKKTQFEQKYITYDIQYR